MQLFSDREEAKKSLEKAETALKQVEAQATEKMLKTRARLSLAKLYETLCRPEEAKKLYQQIAEDEKDSVVGQIAQRAVKRLSDPREVELLAWFAEQKPRRPSPGMGRGGLPGLPNDLPERPDLSLPGLGTGAAEPGAGVGPGLNLEGLGTGKPDESKLEFPKPGETKPAEGDKPAEPKSGEPKLNEPVPPEKPAEAEKPAETKPQ
jgi:hypothetical protein